MSIGLLGKKIGMTRVFNENGQSIPVTVLKIETNLVSMIKNVDTHGYNCLLYTSPSPRDRQKSRMPSSA